MNIYIVSCVTVNKKLFVMFLNTARQELKDLHKKVAMCRDDISMREIEASHDIMALEGLNSNVAEQIAKVSKDIADLNTAMDTWNSMSQKKIGICEDSKNKCFASFNDWSKLWPGVRSWLDTESVSLNSTKTSASLQRCIGEWKGLRSVAIAIKSLNTAMETKAKEGESDLSQPPYDYNIPLNKLKDKLTEQLKHNRQTINSTSQETKQLDDLRKRMNTMLVNLCNALEKDVSETMKDTNRLAAKSLHAQTVTDDMPPVVAPKSNSSAENSLFEDTYSGGGSIKLDENSSIINATAALVDDNSLPSTISGGHTKKLIENLESKQSVPGMHVKHWVQHAAIRGDILSSSEVGEETEMDIGANAGMSIACTGSYTSYIPGKSKDAILKTRSTDERVRLAKGVAHAQDTATIRVLLGLPGEEEIHHHSTNASSSAFTHTNMIAVLASLECRKAFDDIEWAVEKYKATMSKQFMQQLAEDSEARNGTHINIAENKQIFQLIEQENKRDLEKQLDSFHGWLLYQIIGKQLSLSINEPFPSPVDWLIKQAAGASQVLNTREFVPGARVDCPTQHVSALKPPGGNNKSAAARSANLRPQQPPPREGSVNAFGGRRRPPSVVDSKKLYSGSEMDNDDDDEEEAGDQVGSLAESSVGSRQSLQRGESIRQTIHKALMEETDDDVNVAQDRILLQKTVHLPGCQKETLVISIYFQVDCERLRLHVMNINGYALLLYL